MLTQFQFLLRGGVIDDAEWLMDDLSKMEEKDDDMTAKELSGCTSFME